MSITQQLGEIVSRYGSFAVYEVEVYQNGHRVPSSMRQIVLLCTDGSSIPLGSLPARNNTLQHVKDSIHFWLVGQQRQIAQARLLMKEATDEQTLEHFQVLIDQWQSRYVKVLQAFREIDPDYQEEAGPLPKPRNVEYRLVNGRVCPVTTPGTYSKRYGKFCLYQVEKDTEEATSSNSTYDVCLIDSHGGVTRLGEMVIANGEDDYAALLAFLRSWLTQQEHGIERIKERLQTTKDFELRAKLQKILSWEEPWFTQVQRAFAELVGK